VHHPEQAFEGGSRQLRKLSELSNCAYGSASPCWGRPANKSVTGRRDSLTAVGCLRRQTNLRAEAEQSDNTSPQVDIGTTSSSDPLKTGALYYEDGPSVCTSAGQLAQLGIIRPEPGARVWHPQQYLFYDSQSRASRINKLLLSVVWSPWQLPRPRTDPAHRLGPLGDGQVMTGKDESRLRRLIVPLL
jgi:hypothetical protein